MTPKQRTLVAALTLSASAFVGLVINEGYREQAYIPTKGDVPTIGFGSTRHEDGRKVMMGDTTDPINALEKARNHLAREEWIFRRSLPGVHLSQEEYDLYMDWVYQYGTGAWTKSSIRSALLKGEHKDACDALLKYRYVNGYDCSTPGNKICRGVWTRQLERHKACYTAGGFH